MSDTSNRLKAKDFITVGIFTAIIFVVEFACGMLGYIHPFIVASYVVMIPIMFVTGMGFLGAPLIIAAGVIADLIAKSGKYKSFKKTMLSYGVFCLWICANYFPVVITAESYRQDLVDGGYSAEYCNNLFLAINYKTIGILLILCFVFGCLGALLGKAVVKKHFEKAGIV